MSFNDFGDHLKLLKSSQGWQEDPNEIGIPQRNEGMTRINHPQPPMVILITMVSTGLYGC